MVDQGGWLWVVIDVAFVVVFGAGLAYGLMTWRRRRERGVDEVRDRATLRNYETVEGGTRTPPTQGRRAGYSRTATAAQPRRRRAIRRPPGAGARQNTAR